MATATTNPRTRVKRTAATVTAVPEPAAAPAEADDGKVRFELEHAGDTKNYSTWAPPAGSGCVGKLYMPLGTERVGVVMAGATPESPS